MTFNNVEVSDNVIRKIQLLFQMAQRTRNNDGSSNEAEASAAMARAQELLAKYNLDLNVVQGTEVAGGTAEKEAETKRERQQFARTAMYNWQRRLARVICEANYCWYWTVETRDEWQITGGMRKKHDRARKVLRHVILGRKANAVMAEMMYEYLADTIERLVPFKGSERLSRSANSWREGCASRLMDRIRQKKEEMERRDTKDDSGNIVCTAIAVRDLHEKEYAANYDAQNGAGAYARYKARQAEYMKKWEAERQEREELKRLAMENETPEQRARREKREAREAEKQAKRDERYWDRQDRKQRRAAERIDWEAYESGQETANDINLNQQLSSSGKERNKLN